MFIKSQNRKRNNLTQIRPKNDLYFPARPECFCLQKCIEECGNNKEFLERSYIKSGFTLIELIVATLIASMLITVLLSTLTQGTEFQIRLDNVISLSERIAIVSNQLEKDLSGSFIPVQSDIKSADNIEEVLDAEKELDTKEKSTQKAAENPAGEKKQKPIEKIFVSTNKDKMLDTLTFVTNNPLVVFVGKDVGVVKPKIARVQYTLRPETDKKDSYVLFRQESTELDLAKYKNVRPYEVINGIRSCEVLFTARIEKKDDKQKESADKAEQPKITYEYRTMKEWTSERKKKEAQQQETGKKEPELPFIPYLVEFKIVLWDTQEQREKEYTLVFEIPETGETEQKEEKKPRTLGQKQDDKQTPGATEDKTKQPTQKTAQIEEGGSQEIIVYNVIEAANKALDGLRRAMGTNKI